MDQPYEFRQIFLPYCIQKLADGRYIVLNRLYKPLGVHTRDWVTYEDHPSVIKIKGLTAARALKMSWKSEPDIDCIYLYNDGCKPTGSAADMAAYSKRLEVLAKLTCE